MKWNGKDLKTTGDLVDAMSAIMAIEDAADQADEFMTLYRVDSEHADVNIERLTGYFSRDRANLARNLFRVKHPIFGTTNPTLEDAFQAGKDLASKD